MKLLQLINGKKKEVEKFIANLNGGNVETAVSDWNNYTSTGLYSGTGLANECPNYLGVSTVRFCLVMSVTTDVVYQCMSPTDSNEIFVRQKNTSWGDWRQITTAYYDNTISGLTATDVQAAIDEIDADAAYLSVANTFAEAITFSKGTVHPDTSNTYPSYVYNNVASGKISGTNGNGAIKITLPKSWSNTMMQLVVDIFQYHTDQSNILMLSGYNYTSGSTWVNTAAYALQTANFPTNKIRFGHDGTNCCIVIGNVTDTGLWDHTTLNISRMTASFSNFSSGWETGWSIELITDDSGITYSQTEYLSTYADTLGGYAASESATANTIAKRTSSGYLYATYYNMSGPANTISATGYMFYTSDGFLRKKTLANVKTEIVTPAAVAAALTEEATAGEALSAGDICYLKSDGKYWKADASAESTAKSRLLMAAETISANSSGTFYKFGARWTTTGLTVGVPYFLSTTAGGMTTTAPSGNSEVVRVVGYAESATSFIFEPSGDWGTNPAS